MATVGLIPEAIHKYPQVSMMSHMCHSERGSCHLRLPCLFLCWERNIIQICSTTAECRPSITPSRGVLTCFHHLHPSFAPSVFISLRQKTSQVGIISK